MSDRKTHDQVDGLGRAFFVRKMPETIDDHDLPVR